MMTAQRMISKAAAWPALLVAPLLTGCVSRAPIFPPGTAPGYEFACPRAGTVIQTVGSTRTATWLGASPDRPDVCPRRDSRGKISETLFGIYTLPTPNETKKRAAISAAFLGQRKVCFNEIVQPLRMTGTLVDSNVTQLYEVCFQNGGVETIMFDGRPRNTLKIVQTEEGRGQNYFSADRILFFDIKTGIALKMDVNNRRGTPIRGYNNMILKEPDLSKDVLLPVARKSPM